MSNTSYDVELEVKVEERRRGGRRKAGEKLKVKRILQWYTTFGAFGHKI